jgi:hypothetical protein
MFLKSIQRLKTFWNRIHLYTSMGLLFRSAFFICLLYISVCP